jgi:1-acyl-sn-glycerol-3-phosphate acyltransferase
MRRNVKKTKEERALAREARRERFYKKAHALLAKLVLKLFRIRVYHAEREPENQNYLLCVNHTAAMDPVVISAALKKQQPHFMAKKELFSIPILSSLVRLLGAFPVDRGGDVGAIRATMNLLQRGKCVGMFPQGTRCPGVPPAATVGKLKNGAGMLCVRTGVTVLPVCIRAKGDKLRLFGGADVIVGEPIPYEAFGVSEAGHAEYVRVTNIIFEHICRLYEEDATEVEA